MIVLSGRESLRFMVSDTIVTYTECVCLFVCLLSFVCMFVFLRFHVPFNNFDSHVGTEPQLPVYSSDLKCLAQGYKTSP